VEDNLLLGAFQRERRRVVLQKEVADVYKRFPRLNERRGQLAGTLSGGERQMLALGRALMARPKLLMLDEPRLGLAPLVVREMLRRAAERFGDRPLVTIAGGQWRHSDAAEIVARRAGALRAAGIGRGDRVAIMCSNRAELLEVFLACGWLGAVAVPINTASMRPQLEYHLANSGAKLLVLEQQFVPRMPAESPQRWVVGDSYPAPAEPLPAAAVQPGDTLAILYTSGTTGPAKGVTCPHAQYYWWGLNTAAILGVGQDDVLCTTLPLFHINALNSFAQAALMGCCVAFESQ